MSEFLFPDWEPEMRGTKLCNSCVTERPVTDFDKCSSTRDGFQHKCNPCYRKYREQNSHAIAERIRRYGFENQPGGRFRPDPRVYDQMFEDQGGLCAICQRPESMVNPRTGLIRRLALDHDHETNVVRALLCTNCNIGIGYFKDDPERLRAAIAYLVKHGRSAGYPAVVL